MTKAKGSHLEPIKHVFKLFDQNMRQRRIFPGQVPTGSCIGEFSSATASRQSTVEPRFLTDAGDQLTDRLLPD
eukprot:scaffold102410_cov36-Prasinocladus_malaysianus.AAC.1